MSRWPSVHPVVGWFVAIVVLAAGLALVGPVAGPVSAATGGCRSVSGGAVGGGGPQRATVVVDTGAGAVWSACISFDGTVSGIGALDLAARQIPDLSPVYDVYAGQGRAVCKLRGVGNDPPDCLGKSAEYWGYFRNGGYSRVGAGSSVVQDGDVEGWRWGNGSASPRPATDGTEAAVAPPPAVTTTVARGTAPPVTPAPRTTVPPRVTSPPAVTRGTAPPVTPAPRTTIPPRVTSPPAVVPRPAIPPGPTGPAPTSAGPGRVVPPGPSPMATTLPGLPPGPGGASTTEGSGEGSTTGGAGSTTAPLGTTSSIPGEGTTTTSGGAGSVPGTTTSSSPGSLSARRGSGPSVGGDEAASRRSNQDGAGGSSGGGSGVGSALAFVAALVAAAGIGLILRRRRVGANLS